MLLAVIKCLSYIQNVKMTLAQSLQYHLQILVPMPPLGPKVRIINNHNKSIDNEILCYAGSQLIIAITLFIVYAGISLIVLPN